MKFVFVETVDEVLPCAFEGTTMGPCAGEETPEDTTNADESAT